MTNQTQEKVKPIKVEKDSELHLTVLMAPFSLNLVVGEDRACLLRYATSVWQAATLAERERCAKVCENRSMGVREPEDVEALDCAAEIRQGVDV